VVCLAHPFWKLLSQRLHHRSQALRRGLRDGFSTLTLLIGLMLVLVAWLLIASPSAEALPQGVRGAISTPSIAPLLAQTSDVEALRQQQLTLEQQRQQLSNEQGRLKALEHSANSNLRGLQRNLKTTQGQIKTSETDLQGAIKVLQQLETKLSKAEEAYQQQSRSTIARLQFLQRQKLDSGWAVLLQSQTLNDFLGRRYHLKKLYQADRQMLIGLKTTADQLEQQRDQVETQKNSITLMTQQLMLQQSTLEAQATYQKGSIDRLKQDRRAMQMAQTQLDQDSQAISRLIQQRITLGQFAYRGTGQMLLPCAGEVTSGFGWRMHPVLGYERFHSGIDLGADYGSLIHAADRGLVIFAGWYGGYGNAVIIDHGGGITTLYGHASELYIAEGQEVQRGQAIAAVGSTGLSTGPHLHFEVRRNGDPTDPVAFL
jgi:murein DD-endopeptidase MepM/ murein hydrolase activator NlpD